MKKVYGSSSAFMLGQLVETQYSSACLRSVLLASNGVREEFDDKHAERGAYCELDFQNGLDSTGLVYRRELATRSDIPGYPDTIFTGRADFVVKGVGSERILVEIKSTESTHVRLDVIRKGKWKLQNLSQLVAYMIQFQAVKGMLYYAFYKPLGEGKFEFGEDRHFLVEIKDDGGIWVDGEATVYNVEHQLAHRMAVAKVLNEQVIWSRPLGGHEKFSGCCARCPFRSACDVYDASSFMPNHVFIAQAKKCLPPPTK